MLADIRIRRQSKVRWGCEGGHLGLPGLIKIHCWSEFMTNILLTISVSQPCPQGPLESRIFHIFAPSQLHNQSRHKTPGMGAQRSGREQKCGLFGGL